MSIANASKSCPDTRSTRSARLSRTALLWLLTSGISILVAGSSCVKAPEFDEVPKIDFVSLSKDTMLQGLNQEDSITVAFHFEDGDGDIGRLTDSDMNNVFVIDGRTGQLDNTFGIPFVPPQGSSNGIEGEVYLRLYSTCCIYPIGDPCAPSVQYPFNTLVYQIYITDRAGNSSNVIETIPITLICN